MQNSEEFLRIVWTAVPKYENLHNLLQLVSCKFTLSNNSFYIEGVTVMTTPIELRSIFSEFQ